MQETYSPVDYGVKASNFNSYRLLVDGSNFKPYIEYDNETGMIANISHTCITGGDNKYTSIAVASILAKTERDLYIETLCEENPSSMNDTILSRTKDMEQKNILMVLIHESVIFIVNRLEYVGIFKGKIEKN